MKCQSCGSDNPDSAKFCASCGSKFIPQESVFKDLTPPPPPIAPSFNDSSFSKSSGSPFSEVPPHQNQFFNQAPPNQNNYQQNPYNQSGANYQQAPPQSSPYSQYSGHGNNQMQINAANKEASTALTMGIIALFCSATYIFSILALVFGFRSRSNLKELNQPTGTATAAIVLGIVSIIVSIILSVLIMALYASLLESIAY